MTDEDPTIGLRRGTVRLADADPSWPAAFAREAAHAAHRRAYTAGKADFVERVTREWPRRSCPDQPFRS